MITSTVKSWSNDCVEFERLSAMIILYTLDEDQHILDPGPILTRSADRLMFSAPN